MASTPSWPFFVVAHDKTDFNMSNRKRYITENVTCKNKVIFVNLKSNKILTGMIK